MFQVFFRIPRPLEAMGHGFFFGSHLGFLDSTSPGKELEVLSHPKNISQNNSNGFSSNVPFKRLNYM